METPITRNCVHCHKQHNQSSSWCSEECFQVYYAMVQAYTLRFVLEQVFKESITEELNKEELDAKSRKH